MAAEIKASYNAGEALPAQGTPEYAAAAALAKGTPAAPASTTTTDRSGSVSAYDLAKQNALAVENSRATYAAQAESYAASQRQARIDAINTTFAPRVANQQQVNEDSMARVRALNFNKGIVGSGADTTAIGDQTKLNDKALQAITDEKATAIQNAFTWADDLKVKKADELYSTAKGAAGANVDYQKGLADKATAALQIFGKGGYTADDIKRVDPAAYAALRDSSGMSDSAINLYLKTQAPEGTYNWTGAQYNGNKMLVPVVRNGKASVESIDLPFTPQKKIKDTVKTDTGVYIIYEDGTHTNISDGNMGGGGDLLSVTDAKTLGVPYGTTKSQAAKLKIVPAGTDASVTKDLIDADNAVTAGVQTMDSARKIFLQLHPDKGNLFLQYNKQQY
jgi:hypothetical protein